VVVDTNFKQKSKELISFDFFLFIVEIQVCLLSQLINKKKKSLRGFCFQIKIKYICAGLSIQRDRVECECIIVNIYILFLKTKQKNTERIFNILTFNLNNQKRKRKK